MGQMVFQPSQTHPTFSEALSASSDTFEALPVAFQSFSLRSISSRTEKII